MSLPGNGIFVVQGEMAMLVTAMRRSTRWGSHSFPNEEYDVLIRTFHDLRTILNQVDDLRLLDPATYLSPFLEVIRSKETTGPVTSLALSAIHKFLSYGLIDPTHPSVPATVEDIADAVTHARFVGTDHSSDGVVLMKILQVLRTLMLSPEGAMLTDESVCEIMLTCFRICFETRLTELLRRNAEQCLRDMTQLIFMRVPQFAPECARAAFNTPPLSLKKRDKQAKRKTAVTQSTNSLERNASISEKDARAAVDNEETDANKSDLLTHSQDKNLLNEAEITIEPVESSVMSPLKKHARHSSMDLASDNTSITQLLEKCVEPQGEDKAPQPDDTPETSDATSQDADTPPEHPEEPITDLTPDAELLDKEEALQEEVAEADGAKQSKDIETEDDKMEEYVNNRGIRFTPQEEPANLQPYGLVCVRELFRFLISLCNPLDTQNTSAMVHLGLSLVGTALEVGADQIAKCPSLLMLVKDPLCRNLTSLLSTERISIFALDLQISFLLFEALRFHLKFQMEAFLKKIIEIISSDTSKAIYELKEIHHLALEYLAQMFRIPGLCSELYLNYDCDIYCTDMFEELTNLLSKNVVSSTAYNIHQLSLEALMTIIEAIEAASNQAMVESVTSEEESPASLDDSAEHKFGRGGHVCLELGGLDDSSSVSEHVTHNISLYVGAGRVGRHRASSEVPSEVELDNIRKMKKWMTQGTELFNQKPERGVEFLQQHGVFASPLDVHQVALWLRENPQLDKKMIGEYICKRSSRGEDEGPSILAAFADSFDFSGLRIDQALRLYLETFRLPGEAPLIFLVMERFAERWHSTNGSPFANTDAAFRLAYAVIMLNMDQHNHNAKKLNVPMTVADFVKNLRGCNGSGDFHQPMLEAVFHAIKGEEMVMPAERVGPVRDAYLWRVLQRRGSTPAARYLAAPPRRTPLLQLRAVACAPAVTALSASFERAPPPLPEEIESTTPTDNAALSALDGLSRCAALLARLPGDGSQLSVDSLLLTLCKSTGLLPAAGDHVAIGVTLGQSTKAQAALRRACVVAARHADCVRASWRHLLEIVNTLYMGHLLPKSLVEAEDYLTPNGTVSLIREAARTTEAGLLSSLYYYIALGDDKSAGARPPTLHERILIEAATKCVTKCKLPALLVTETKFLHLDSLRELIRAMVTVGAPPDPESLQMNPALEDVTIFFLELLGQTLIQNRDRCLEVWDEAGPHYANVISWATTRDATVLRRALTALLRSCARLMRSEHAAPKALARLNLLFDLPYKLFYQQADVISCGLYELVKTSAQNVHSADEWRAVFALLSAAGAGAWPRPTTNTASSRSEGSEDEIERRPTSASSDSDLSHSPHTQGWILVKSDSTTTVEGATPDATDVWLRPHRASALVRCCEAMTLVVRDVAHVTPYNCRAAVRTVRLFVRATLHGARCCEALTLVVRDVAHVTPYNCRAAVRTVRLFVRATLHGGKKPGTKSSRDGSKSRPRSGRRSRGQEDSSDEEDEAQEQYLLVSLQLLDLMHTLHSRTAQIFRWWREEAEQGQRAEEHDLWEVAWMPLLQGIAQFCTDRRRQVWCAACAYLQRALLAPALSCMDGARWEACFTRVLFPLLERAPRRRHHPDTIMCKVFLHHLSALSSRPTFAALWLRVVGIQQALVTSHVDDPVTEAALESLKNMILVMNSVKIFSNGDGYNDLWYLTWEKVGEFLPNLKEELFPQANDAKPPPSLPSHMQPSLPSTLPTLVPVAPTLPSSTPTIVPQAPASLSTSPVIVQGFTGQNPGFQVQNPGFQAQNPGFQVQNPVNPSQNPANPSQNPLGYPGQALQYPGSVTSPPVMTPSPPVSGMVPIRNTLYAGGGLTSSVLLQPLNEMTSTSIGTSMTNQMPILYPSNTAPQLQQPKPAEPSKTDPKPQAEEPTLQPTHRSTVLDISDSFVPPEVQQSEIYSDYINNPYNEVKDVSTKEVVLYEPQDNLLISSLDPETLRNPLLDLEKQKSFSANTSPMHGLAKTKAQFGSSDNLKKDESGMFNFSSYFGISDGLAPGSEVFDNLMSTQEG